MSKKDQCDFVIVAVATGGDILEVSSYQAKPIRGVGRKQRAVCCDLLGFQIVGRAKATALNRSTRTSLRRLNTINALLASICFV